ncbi:MAG: hypothetical protein QME66_13465 [Candidatus Eisenbacteria bacterium]|nr:hypothetical protein [Candidatus Eisenbacteria bacterium]
MTRNVVILAASLAVSCSAYAVDGKDSYARYRFIIEDKSILSQAERTAKVRQHLCSMSEEDFWDFIRELARDPEYDWEKHAEAPIGMAMLAGIYYLNLARLFHASPSVPLCAALCVQEVSCTASPIWLRGL